MRSRLTKVRLSIITFFLFFAFGSTGPILSLYLQDRLHFTGTQIGAVLSMSAFSALVSPVVCTFFADRVISSERLFGVLLLAGGVLMGALYRTQSFAPFVGLYLLYHLAIGATASLLNAITFHKLDDRREYGRVRVWGTVGWIAVAWIFGWLWLRGSGGEPIPERLADALLLSALSLAGLGLYSLTLPPSVEPEALGKPEFLPRAALAVMRRPEAIWLAVVSTAMTVSDRIYTCAAAIFLKQSGVSESNVLPMLSIGQLPEVLAMVLLGRLTARLGLAPVMLLGALSNAARYALFIFGRGSPIALTCGVLMHGLAYTFFFSALFIVLDGMAEKESRAGVHQLFGLAYGGIGGMLGSWMAGTAMDACKLPDGTIRFGALWSIPLGIAIAVTAALSWGLLRRGSAPAARVDELRD